MNEVSSTAQIPTNAFADEVLFLSLGAEFVLPLYLATNLNLLGKTLELAHGLSARGRMRRKVAGQWLAFKIAGTVPSFSATDSKFSAPCDSHC